MRVILAVVLAFVAMSVTVLALSLAPWFVFGVGWLCAGISRSRAAVYVLAALCSGAGLTNHFSQHHKPEPGPRPAGVSVMDAVVQRKEPDWFTLASPALGVAALVLAGRARLSE
jgi:hypothetical protein